MLTNEALTSIPFTISGFHMTIHTKKVMISEKPLHCYIGQLITVVPSSLTLANRTDLKYSLVWLVTILQQRPLPKHPNSEVLFSSILEDCQKLGQETRT